MATTTPFGSGNATQAPTTIPFGGGSQLTQPKSFTADKAPARSLADSIWDGIAGYGKNIANTLQNSGNNVNAAFTDPTKSPLEQGINASGQAAAGVMSTGASLIPGGTTALNAVGGAFNAATNAAGNIGDTLGGLVNKIPGVNFNQTKYDADNAQFANSSGGQAINRTADVGNNLGNIANLILGAEGGVQTANKIPTAVQSIHDLLGGDKGPPGGPSGPGGSIGTTAIDIAQQNPGGLITKVQSILAKENVDPRLATSAARLDNPLDLYNQHADQAAIAVKDIKADTPMAVEGSNLGNAYDKVAQLRRSIGKQMGQELNNIKDTPLDISSSIESITKEVKDPETGQLKVGKMTTLDRQILGNYLKELNALGKNPTAGQLDDFLGRVPEELKVTKAKNNITDITNAERIVKTSLSSLRDSLNPAKGAPPEFQPYYDARQTYANLSNFLDEGSKYLGAKTQTGDYTKDVSLAKSSAESLVAGGKKDWLLKLEALTGHPALDRIMIAIQSMLDAGDNRGVSLFKSLTQGDMATPKGIAKRLAGWVAGKAAEGIVGSKADQTRAFLKTLNNGQE